MTVTPADDLTRLLRAVAPKLRRLADQDEALGYSGESERKLADRCDIYADQLTDAGAAIICPDVIDKNWTTADELVWSDGQPIRAHVDPAELALREAQDDARNERQS